MVSLNVNKEEIKQGLQLCRCKRSSTLCLIRVKVNGSKSSAVAERASSLFKDGRDDKEKVNDKRENRQ